MQDDNTTPNSTVPDSFKARTTFKRYQLVAELGRGGMGVVYKAYDTDLQRYIALKVIKTFHSEIEKQRFKREASLMAKLSHAYIIKIFDVGEHQDVSFFTMELIEGENLGRLIQRQTPLATLVKILDKVAYAVHYAHEQGIIHRDLKPSNIMIKQDYEPVVMDFGLAKSIEGKDEKLSISQDILGTPEYMSPEQADDRHKGIDAQTDVYSLGVILYEIITGRTPFSGTNPMNILYQITFTEPQLPSRLNPNISKELEAVCLKAMEKEKSRRYHSAKELGRELDRYLEGKPVKARPITPVVRASLWIGRHRLVSSLSFGIVLAFLFLVAFFTHKLKLEKDEAVSLRAIAETKKAEAVEKEMEAKLSEINSELSRAESEMVLAKMAVEKQNYFLAYEKKLEASQILSKVNSCLEILSKVNSSFESATFSAHFSERKSILSRQSILLNQTSRHLLYSIFPNPHHPMSAPLQWSEVSWKDMLQNTESYDHAFINFSFQCCYFQPSWKWFIRHTGKGKIELWNMWEKKIVRTLPMSVYYYAVSPDDQLIWIGNQDGEFLVYDTRSDTVKNGKIQLEKKIDVARFSPDCKWLFLATDDNQFVLYGLPDLVPYSLNCLKGKNKICCAFSQNSKILVVGANGLSFFDLDKIQNDVSPYYKLENKATSICFGPEDKTLFFTFRRDIFIVPTVSPGTEANSRETVNRNKETVALMDAHQGDIYSLVLSPDNNFFASAGHDGRLIFWNSHSCSKLWEAPIYGLWEIKIYGETPKMVTVHFYPESKKVGVWNFSGISLYPYETKRLARTLDLMQRPEISASHKTIIKKAVLQEMNIRGLKPNQGLIISFSHSARYLAFYVYPNLYLWDKEKDILSYLGYFIDTKGHVAFNQDDSQLLCRIGNQAGVWQVDDKKQIARKNARRLFFAPQKDCFLTCLEASDRSVIQLWKMDNAALVKEKEISLSGYISSVSFDKSGRTIYINQAYFLNFMQFENNDIRPIMTYSPESINTIEDFCLSEDSCVACGDQKSGNVVFYNWQTKQELNRLNLYSPIARIWYQKEEKLYWILTENGLFIYPHVEDPATKEHVNKIYPLPVFKGYPISSMDISPDFEYSALFLQSGEIMLYTLKDNKRF